MKRFLITYTSEFGMQQSYFASEFNESKDFSADHQMIVFDLEKQLMKVNSCGWAKIDADVLRHPNFQYDGGKTAVV